MITSFNIYVQIPPENERHEIEVETPDLPVQTLVEQIIDQLQLPVCEEGIQIQYSLVRFSHRYEKVDANLTVRQAGVQPNEEFSISRDFLLTPELQAKTAPHLAPVTEEYRLIHILHPRSSPLPDLTPDYLVDHVASYLQALNEIQQVLDEANNRPISRLKIKQIRQSSFIFVTLEGVAEVTHDILVSLSPWKRRRIQTLAELEVKEKEVELEQKRIGLLRLRREMAKPDQADRPKGFMEGQLEEERQRRLDQTHRELQKQLLEIDQRDSEQITQILRVKAPCLTGQQRAEYAAMLRPAVVTVLSEEIELMHERDMER